MNLVNQAKRLRGVAVDRLHPQRVVFHHVPKCGGTSVGRALRKRFLFSQATISPESSFRAVQAFVGGDANREDLLVEVLDFREQMLLYHLAEDIRCVSAHVRFSVPAHDLYRSNYKFITILREPVARFLSHYTWSYGKPEAHARIEEPFEAFLETERARRMGATYVEFFSGLPKSADIRSPEAIDAAVANLSRLDVVGRLDDLDGFTSALKDQLGVQVRIGHENRARQRTRSATAMDDPVLRGRILDLCAPDIEVWERHLGLRGAGTSSTPVRAAGAATG